MTQIIITRDDKGFSYTNLSHHYEVRKARDDMGWGDSDKKINNVEIKDHHLIGKYIYRRLGNKWYKIEKINKQWYAGFYYGMLIQNSGSHAFIAFENINCNYDLIIESCEECKVDFDWENLKDHDPTCTMGININDSEESWTEMILDGTKTIETRNTDSLRPYVGKRVGIIRTGVGKATLVGYMNLCEPIIYDTHKAFRVDEHKHRVGRKSKFDIAHSRGTKYGYPIKNVERVYPVQINSRGVVARKIV